MLESSRDMLIPGYSRCHDIVGSEYTSILHISMLDSTAKFGLLVDFTCIFNVLLSCDGIIKSSNEIRDLASRLQNFFQAQLS